MAGIPPLERLEVGHPFQQQAVAVDHPDPRQGDRLGEPRLHQRRQESVGDPAAGRAGAEDHDVLIRESLAGGQARRQDGRVGDGCGPLDVVIERAEPVAIAVQQPPRIGQREVLPLEQHVRQRPRDGLDELLDEVVVGRAADPAAPVAEVEGIVPLLGVVGADVQEDRQGPRRVDAAAEGVQRELADRDAHPADPEVPQAEDPLAIGHDDHVDPRGTAGWPGPSRSGPGARTR